jgi:hypothetical protein
MHESLAHTGTERAECMPALSRGAGKCGAGVRKTIEIFCFQTGSQFIPELPISWLPFPDPEAELTKLKVRYEMANHT